MFFKTNFSGQNKISKFGGHCPRMPPVVTGLLLLTTTGTMVFIGEMTIT